LDRVSRWRRLVNEFRARLLIVSYRDILCDIVLYRIIFPYGRIVPTLVMTYWNRSSVI